VLCTTSLREVGRVEFSLYCVGQIDIGASCFDALAILIQLLHTYTGLELVVLYSWRVHFVFSPDNSYNESFPFRTLNARL